MNGQGRKGHDSLGKKQEAQWRREESQETARPTQTMPMQEAKTAADPTIDAALATADSEPCPKEKES